MREDLETAYFKMRSEILSKLINILRILYDIKHYIPVRCAEFSQNFLKFLNKWILNKL